jgi:hypothetical protein
MSAAETALEKNNVTFAMMPIQRLLSAEGYIAKLKARGYRVEEPESMTEQ